MYQDPIMPTAPDLAPTSPDIHRFGLLQDSHRGRRFADDNKLPHRVPEELRHFSKEFYATDTQHFSREGGKSVLIMKKTLWENNLNFVRYVV